MFSALYAITRLSICPSHGWISQKRSKLGLCNFHRAVATSLWFLWDKFHPEILMVPPEWVSNKGWVGNDPFSTFERQYLENGRRYVQSYC